MKFQVLFEKKQKKRKDLEMMHKNYEFIFENK